MVERKTPGEIILLVFIYAAVTLVGFVCLYPMLYCLAASFSDPMKLLTHSGALFFPTGFSLRGYQVVMNNPNILIGYHNTLLYVAGSLIVGMTLPPLGAYALSCKGYPFRKAIVFLFVFTMYFSGGMVPNFLTISAYGMYNTAWAIILPTAVSTYNMIVMRTTHHLCRRAGGIAGIGLYRRRKRLCHPLSHLHSRQQGHYGCHHPVLRGKPVEQLVPSDDLSARFQEVAVADDPARDSDQRRGGRHIR